MIELCFERVDGSLKCNFIQDCTLEWCSLRLIVATVIFYRIRLILIKLFLFCYFFNSRDGNLTVELDLIKLLEQ